MLEKIWDFFLRNTQDFIVIGLLVHFYEINEWQGWAWMISYSIAAACHDWIIVEEGG